MATFVAKRMVCQQMKAEHQKTSSLLQPLEIPKWKWDKITMDFVVDLPRTQRKNDVIWVIVDRLTKSTHFIPIKIKTEISTLAKLYIHNIIHVHGVSSSIMLDRDPGFTSKF